MGEPLVPMDMISDATSEIVEYIVRHHTNYPLEELEVVDGDEIRYSDRVQDIYNNVLDIIDNEINGDY